MCIVLANNSECETKKAFQFCFFMNYEERFACTKKYHHFSKRSLKSYGHEFSKTIQISNRALDEVSLFEVPTLENNNVQMFV